MSGGTKLPGQKGYPDKCAPGQKSPAIWYPAIKSPAQCRCIINDGMLHGLRNKLLQFNTYYWKPNITRNSPMFNFPFHTSPLSANLIRKDLEKFYLNKSTDSKSVYISMQTHISVIILPYLKMTDTKKM